MLARLLVLFLSVAGAFELPATLSRRTIARAVATAPLVAAGAAFADANNVMYGFSKEGLGKGDFDKYGAPTKAIGRQSLVDEAGAAIPATASWDTKKVAACFRDSCDKNPAKDAALKRLLGSK